MAVYVLLNPQISVNGVDLSDHATSVSWSQTAEEIDTTSFGSSHRTRVGGLTDGSITLELQQDFAGGATWATLKDLLGKTVAVKWQPASGAVSATNPSYSVDVLISQLPITDGAVGELATISATWPFAGAVTVATS